MKTTPYLPRLGWARLRPVYTEDYEPQHLRYNVPEISLIFVTIHCPNVINGIMFNSKEDLSQ